MYPLGKQFEVDYTKAKSDKKVVVQGNNYRITVISERIVRLEFSPTGQFNDRPTQLIKKRNIGLPDFSVRQDANFVEITTKYFALNYIKGQPFVGPKVDPMKNLKITLLLKIWISISSSSLLNNFINSLIFLVGIIILTFSG